MVTKVFFGPVWSASKWAMYDIVKAEDIEYCDFDEGKFGKIQKVCLSNHL